MTYVDEVLADAPYLYYRLGEASGSAINLGSAGTVNATYSSVTRGQAGLVGDADLAALFSGPSSSSVSTTTGVLPNNTSLTVEFWMQTSTKALGSVIARDSATASQRVWQIRVNGSGQIFFSNPVSGDIVISTRDVCDGQPHHIAVTVASTTMALYIDGTLESPGSTSTLRTTTSTGLTIGRSPNTAGGYTGVLDEVAIYTTALSATRIAAHHTAAAPPPPPPPTEVIIGATSAGSGSTTVALVPLPAMRMVIPDNVVLRAPSSTTVILTEAIPSVDVTFSIDGTPVLTTPANTEGEIEPTSIPISETLGTQGTHTVTASQPGAASATATFEILHNPNTQPRSVQPDVDAVDLPGAILHGIRHWVLQDLKPGGLGSYVLPVMPSTWVSPHVKRSLDATHTTARTGMFHITESADTPAEFSFRGYCPTQEMHDQLRAYGNLRRRFYLIDHRNRAWKVAFTKVDLVARRRQYGLDHVPTDWGHDYTVTALAYSQDWSVPQ